ncbi:GNAT family N-acetyltransferase [Geomicrobium sp. JCM 19055]|uniref:GNAT family N-acetyltransferase n=1 Tax=Geomicrobium sp. JCM 19055 TaxID=1460649 RepID=UPI00045ED6D0|nr:GNAT family N-acetyltransferase [Geomicrobium sp. JCM 19055]GAK00805.1 acetyltransferase, GNAT family [Geomicrobium sp. JCM 19055]
MSIIQLDHRYDDMYHNLRVESMQTSFGSKTYDPESLDAAELDLRNYNRYTLGAFRSQKLIGFTSLTIQRDNELRRHRALHQAVYVTHPNEGQGYGTKLVQSAIDIAKSHPAIEQVLVSINANQPHTLRFYERLGFTIYGTERNAIKTVEGQSFDEHLLMLTL